MSGEIKRAILKLSGERFSSPNNPLSFEQFDSVAKQLIQISQITGVEMAFVVGGGNLFRGREAAEYVDPVAADHMGMMATMINGVGLSEALKRNAGEERTRLMFALPFDSVGEPFITARARHHLNEKRLIVLAGGLGQPNFTTDSAVAQYADTLKCQIILKASTVDGIYDSDPRKNASAQRLSVISYRDALLGEIQVMDSTAFASCTASKIPIFVFSIDDLDKVPRALKGDFSFGSLVTKDGKLI